MGIKILLHLLLLEHLLVLALSVKFFLEVNLFFTVLVIGVWVIKDFVGVGLK